jgi:hypothetical protein
MAVSGDSSLAITRNPVIRVQPQSQTLPQTATAVFKTIVESDSPASLQWEFNDVAIPGAHDASYSIPNVHATHSGRYSLAVSNAYAVVVSDIANLNVTGPPGITLQPKDQTVVEGGDAIFSVSAVGTPPLRYQWFLNAKPIAEANSTDLIVTKASNASAGTYSVSIMNDYGTIQSADALLRVDHAPYADASATSLLVLSSNGRNALVMLNGTNSFDEDADPLHFSWFEPPAPDPLAAAALAGVVLSVGTHVLELVVNDGWVQSTNKITIEVMTVGAAIEQLILLASGLADPHSKSLIVQLNLAFSALQRNHVESAADHLRVFQILVRAQVAVSDPYGARILIDAAGFISEFLSIPRPSSGVDGPESSELRR